MTERQDLDRLRQALATVEAAVERHSWWSGLSNEQRSAFLVGVAVAGSVFAELDLDVDDSVLDHAKAYTLALGRKWQHSRPRGPR